MSRCLVRCTKQNVITHRITADLDRWKQRQPFMEEEEEKVRTKKRIILYDRV